MLRVLLSVLCGVMILGCAGPRSPGKIAHVVFVELEDPGDAPALLEESLVLADIGGVVSFSAGPHIDTGRGTVLSDYDIGLVIGFDSEEDYASYVTDPIHTAFVNTWKPRLKALRVYDIHDGPITDRD